MAEVRRFTRVCVCECVRVGFDPLHLFDPTNGGAGILSQEWLRCAGLQFTHACVSVYVWAFSLCV